MLERLETLFDDRLGGPRERRAFITSPTVCATTPVCEALIYT
jgi:hypothetical protein